MAELILEPSGPVTLESVAKAAASLKIGSVLTLKVGKTLETRMETYGVWEIEAVTLRQPEPLVPDRAHGIVLQLRYIRPGDLP